MGGILSLLFPEYFFFILIFSPELDNMQVNYGMLAANNEIPVSLSHLNTGKAKAGSILLCYQQQRLLPTVLSWTENVASTRMTQSPIGSPYKIKQIEMGKHVTRGHREEVYWHVHRLIDCFWTSVSILDCTWPSSRENLVLFLLSFVLVLVHYSVYEIAFLRNISK